MRVVFLGYQTWGHVVLKALLESRHSIGLVITHPDSEHVYETIWNDSVKELADRHDVPVIVRQYANDEEVRRVVGEFEPDILVSSDWRTWLSPLTYELAKHGAINIHDAALPRYGGFAPLNWALINGEEEVGVTVHFMNEHFDLGDIVLQERLPVTADETVTELFHKTVGLFPSMTLRALDLIEYGPRDWIPQDPSQATFFHKRSVEDSRIDWAWSATDIVNLVRAQTDPYPNAFTFYEGRRLQILKASVSSRRYGGTQGRLFRREDEGVAVVCGPHARRGVEPGVIIKRVRDETGAEHAAGQFFQSMGGYLTMADYGAMTGNTRDWATSG